MTALPLSSREGNEPGDELAVTYRQLLQRVCQFANVLKSRGQSPRRRHGDGGDALLLALFPSAFAGVKKGDRVSIYMPMVVELVVAMLACARIGAVHSIVVSVAAAATTGAGGGPAAALTP